MAIRSSTSYVRDRIEALKVQKKLEREVEQALAAKKEAEDAEKKRISDHRIATKMARINGTEPPAPLEVVAQEPEAVAEPEPEAVSEPEPEVEKPKKKAPAKKVTKQRTKR